MKKLVFITNIKEKYENLIKKIQNDIEDDSNINVEFANVDNVKLEQGCLYVLEAKNEKDLSIADAEYPFIVISDCCDTGLTKTLAVQAYKKNVLDILLNPGTEECIYTKIKRYLFDYEKIFDSQSQLPETITLGFYDVISRDIKGATRGEYDYSLIGLYINKNKNKEIIRDFVNKNVRETDTPMLYGDNLFISLPFCDREGTYVVIDKLNKLIKEKYKFNVNCSSATLGVDGDTKEELVDYVVSNMKVAI